MRVCVCVCVCGHLSVYTCVWTSVCMRVCGHLCIRVCVDICLYTCVWTSVCMRVCGHRSVMCVRATVHVSVCVLCVYTCAWTCVSASVWKCTCHYNFEMLMCTIFILTIIVQFEMDIQYGKHGIEVVQ